MALAFSVTRSRKRAGRASAPGLVAADSVCASPHYGLGCTLVELGRYREAYAHLRFYTELAPFNGWAWCWLGQAAAGLGSPEEARAAYAQALELEDAGGFETDASEMLEDLMP